MTIATIELETADPLSIPQQMQLTQILNAAIIAIVEQTPALGITRHTFVVSDADAGQHHIAEIRKMKAERDAQEARQADATKTTEAEQDADFLRAMKISPEVI